IAELARRAQARLVIADTERFGQHLLDQHIVSWARLVEPEATDSVPGMARLEALEPDDPAYVIFTSGSTGRPKGVVIPHRGLSNLVAWYRREHDLSADDRMTQLGSPSFDLSILEVWPCLSAGASLHFPDERIRADPPRLTQWMG